MDDIALGRSLGVNGRAGVITSSVPTYFLKNKPSITHDDSLGSGFIGTKFTTLEAETDNTHLQNWTTHLQKTKEKMVKT